jgi:hypothetical protein
MLKYSPVNEIAKADEMVKPTNPADKVRLRATNNALGLFIGSSLPIWV